MLCLEPKTTIYRVPLYDMNWLLYIFYNCISISHIYRKFYVFINNHNYKSVPTDTLFLYNLHFVEFLTHALVIFLVHMQINWAHFMILIKDNADNNIHIVYVNKYKIRRELKTKKNSEYFRIKQKLQQKCKKWIKVIICNCKTNFNHWLAT